MTNQTTIAMATTYVAVLFESANCFDLINLYSQTILALYLLPEVENSRLYGKLIDSFIMHFRDIVLTLSKYGM